MLLRRALIAALCGLALPAGRAQAPSDARIKARIALNLIRFTQWPAAALGVGEPFVLCVAHRSEATAMAFAELEGQAVAGHPVRVQSNANALPRACHALYVEAEAERSASGLMVAAAGQPILTLGDGDGFVQRGMVGLVNVNDSIRFDIHLSRLRAAHLNLNSQVLKLARQVLE